jgi:hypothetical protein
MPQFWRGLAGARGDDPAGGMKIIGGRVRNAICALLERAEAIFTMAVRRARDRDHAKLSSVDFSGHHRRDGCGPSEIRDTAPVALASNLGFTTVELRDIQRLVVEHDHAAGGLE